MYPETRETTCPPSVASEGTEGAQRRGQQSHQGPAPSHRISTVIGTFACPVLAQYRAARERSLSMMLCRAQSRMFWMEWRAPGVPTGYDALLPRGSWAEILTSGAPLCEVIREIEQHAPTRFSSCTPAHRHPKSPCRACESGKRLTEKNV